MTNTANINFEITTGDTFKSEWFFVEDIENNIIDLSTFEIKWGAKKTFDGGYILNTMPINCVKNSTSVEIDNVIYTANQVFFFSLTSSQTQELSNYCNNNILLYDVQIKDDADNITTIITGNLKINRQITI